MREHLADCKHKIDAVSRELASQQLPANVTSDGLQADRDQYKVGCIHDISKSWVVA